MIIRTFVFLFQLLPSVLLVCWHFGSFGFRPSGVCVLRDVSSQFMLLCIFLRSVALCNLRGVASHNGMLFHRPNPDVGEIAMYHVVIFYQITHLR